MLTKPKITILSLLIIAILSLVPIITASEDFFLDSNDDLLFPEGSLEESTQYSYDPYYYTYDDSPDAPELNNIPYLNTEPEESEYEEDMFVYDPYHDPIDFDDPFDAPGDDIPEIAPEDIPTAPQPTEKEPDLPAIKEDGYSIRITGTRMPSKITAGDQLMFKIYVKNTGKSIDHMKITLVNQELALRDSIGPIDLDRGDKASKTLLLDFPFKVQPGYYYLRITVHADGIDRVIYRDIYVA